MKILSLKPEFAPFLDFREFHCKFSGSYKKVPVCGSPAKMEESPRVAENQGRRVTSSPSPSPRRPAPLSPAPTPSSSTATPKASSKNLPPLQSPTSSKSVAAPPSKAASTPKAAAATGVDGKSDEKPSSESTAKNLKVEGTVEPIVGEEALGVIVWARIGSHPW